MSLRLSMLLTVSALLILAIAPHSAYAASPEYTCQDMSAHVYNDGSVNVTLTIILDRPPQEPENISITTIGAPIYASAVADNGTILPVTINNGINVTVFPGIQKVRVTYVTLDATSKTGEKWTLDFNATCNARVYLPEDAVPAKLEPEPRIVVTDEGLALVFPKGHIHIEYYLAPVSPQPTSPAGGGSTTGGGAPGTSNTSNTSSTAAATAIVVVLVLYYFLKRRRGAPSGGSPQIASAVLDDRDRSIIEAVRRAGPRGLTASEIMSETGIPKTPLYRRLNRLVREGVLEAVEEGGVRRYRLKG
ncbi:MAG: winged helix-turn-helix transcriptional regulator [Desulfurococcales archaeon]|nr:winged helix-turn-helix transcriptional regulator [Desulfurococcales archaeon]